MKCFTISKGKEGRTYDNIKLIYMCKFYVISENSDKFANHKHSGTGYEREVTRGNQEVVVRKQTPLKTNFLNKQMNQKLRSVDRHLTR